ncbi:hypothetical protein [Shewanella surugensis]|uniref:Uncharacterized protein n=1 Tax=Shewanella surugensis TaxID=212020 RepID=A0ABT0LHA9_9GAMM|nr:hypothetical protein [Shewanella surugensis]MCL1127088.1 hypothetical protein [Shewanella surugensis]
MSILEASIGRLAREISGSTTLFHYYAIGDEKKTLLKEELQQHIHVKNKILFARYSVPLEDCHASVL